MERIFKKAMVVVEADRAEQKAMLINIRPRKCWRPIVVTSGGPVTGQ
jgi:hypothetical protein